jgi:hypothetical protein
VNSIVFKFGSVRFQRVSAIFKKNRPIFVTRLGLTIWSGFQFWAVGSVRLLAKTKPFPASVVLEFAVATPGLGLLAPDRFFVQA